MNAVLPLFHVMDDVCVPSTHEAGYVFAFCDDGMVLIKSFDGKVDGWYWPNELERFSVDLIMQWNAS